MTDSGGKIAILIPATMMTLFLLPLIVAFLYKIIKAILPGMRDL